MPKQNPVIKLTSSTKTKLQSLKRNTNETFDQVITRAIYSAQPQIPGTPTGGNIAGVGAGLDAYNTYGHVMNWISDTSKKLIGSSDNAITPSMREQGYDIEPLVNGIICPFLKNVILNDYSLETNDNKKYEFMIDDIEEFMKEIELMMIFRDDFEDYALKHGHSFRRKDYDGDTLTKLQRLEARAMLTYEDPFNSDYVAYHQRIYASDIWSSVTTTTNQEINSWWVPGGLIINQDENIYEDGAKEVWAYYEKRFSITETARLRVDDSNKIIAMHKVRPGKPAPIDGALQAIWEKRTLLANLPNVIYSVLMPFMHMKKGIMMESVDEMGQKTLISSVPQVPPADMATTDPEKYNVLLSNYNSYITSMTNDVENLNKYRGEGGLFASGPDTELNIRESASSIAPGFITVALSQLNEDIGQAFGFPVSLVMARGTELATSRAIQDLFNTVYAGTKADYERIANELIEERFAGQKWDYEIDLKDGTTESGTFTFEDTGVEFKLSSGDVQDNLKLAQTELINFQTAQIAKAIGATKPDIQAFLDEKEQGIWDLDNYDVQAQPVNPWGSPSMGNEPQPNQGMNKAEVPQVGKPALPADAKMLTVGEQIASAATGTTKEKFDINEPATIPKKADKTLEADLMAAYDACEAELKNLKLKV